MNLVSISFRPPQGRQLSIVKCQLSSGFTLIEILIAVSIFAVISTIISGLYIQSFRETRRANIQNQLYEDARFILNRIAQEIQSGTIDYDEYYNQYVVRGSNYGQSFGRYYSSFFNPGSDEAFGFDCDDARNGGAKYDPQDDEPAPPQVRRSDRRNHRECIPLRRTLDRNTGSNPFIGKGDIADPTGGEENALCGTLGIVFEAGLDNRGYGPACNGARAPDESDVRELPELYLISADSTTKTILTRERIGGTHDDPIFALALLRLTGYDLQKKDGIIDSFICANEFQCRGDNTQNVPGIDPYPPINDCPIVGNDLEGELPRIGESELNPEGPAADTCDTSEGAFSKDFVPISPFTVNVSRLNFVISPLDDPHYAFAEQGERKQPRVTIVLTVEANPEYSGLRSEFPPVTLVETVTSRVATPVKAPVWVK